MQAEVVTSSRPTADAPADSVRLSLSHEAELRAYFGRYVPPVPGEQSNFGAMCTRMASSRPGSSAERPTPGTPWTELIECGSEHGAANFDGEDAMVAYLDARRRFRLVSAALAQLSDRDQAVLDAYYGAEPTEHALGRLADVACLTETAWARNRSRAARGMHEPIEATVRWLAAATAPDARAAFEQVRQEAATILAAARAGYATARRAGCGSAACPDLARAACT
jgi:hypothetical protein